MFLRPVQSNFGFFVLLIPEGSDWDQGLPLGVDNNDFVLFPNFGRIIPANEEKRQLIFRTYTEQQGTAMKLTKGKWKEEEEEEEGYLAQTRKGGIAHSWTHQPCTILAVYGERPGCWPVTGIIGRAPPAPSISSLSKAISGLPPSNIYCRRFTRLSRQLLLYRSWHSSPPPSSLSSQTACG